LCASFARRPEVIEAAYRRSILARQTEIGDFFQKG